MVSLAECPAPFRLGAPLLLDVHQAYCADKRITLISTKLHTRARKDVSQHVRIMMNVSFCRETNAKSERRLLSVSPAQGQTSESVRACVRDRCH